VPDARVRPGKQVAQHEEAKTLKKLAAVAISSKRNGKENVANPEFYTVSQLARLLQLTEMTIYRMVHRGELPCYSIGRVKRFRQNDVEAFLKRCRVPAAKG
jgi:excisionase family DNA binding protein